MSRFQALTNTVLDAELDRLRERLGLAPNQKAELLREMAAITGWVAHQASPPISFSLRSKRDRRVVKGVAFGAVARVLAGHA